ncbi:MAG: hypothetical protein IT426_04815 [Pirellulales bacterium]|nr:hypothetical protein [Pirellulales bacterium]
MSTEVPRADFLPRILRAMLLLLAAVISSASSSAETVHWNIDANGSWSGASNWMPQLPGIGDDVVIDRPNAAVTVTRNSTNDSIDSLACNEMLVLSGGILDVEKTMRIDGGCELNGGTLGGGGAVQIAGTMNWNGGTISSSGGISVAAGGNLALGGGNLYLNGTSLVNAGTVAQSGYGNFYAQGTNAAFDNLAGGLFDCRSDSSISTFTGAGATFNNSGTFRKSAGSGKSLVAWTFNNAGIVEVQTGTLRLSGGGTHRGTFNVAAGTKLEFSQGTHSFSGAAFSNSGTILLSGGTAYFNAPAVLPEAVTLAGVAILGGPGAVTFENLTWSGGTLSGKAVVAPGGSLTIGGEGTTRYFNGGSLTNAGTVVWNGSNNLVAQGYNVRFENLSGGVIDCRGDSSLLRYGGANHALVNAGVFRKSGGTAGGATAVEWAFNNSGEVKIDAGTLRLTGGGTCGGTFAVAPNAKLEFAGGHHVFAGAALANDGLLRFTGGTFDTLAPIAITGTGATVVFGTGVKFTASSIVQNSLTIGTIPSAVPEPSAFLLFLSAGLVAACGRLFRMGYARNANRRGLAIPGGD